mgnify:CR=1 FL=1
MSFAHVPIGESSDAAASDDSSSAAADGAEDGADGVDGAADSDAKLMPPPASKSKGRSRRPSSKIKEKKVSQEELLEPIEPPSPKPRVRVRYLLAAACRAPKLTVSELQGGSRLRYWTADEHERFLHAVEK